MSDYKDKDYKIFNLFKKQWALVSAGDIDNFNACTVSWGSFGTLWTRPDNKEGATITVYIHPGRYTNEFMKKSDVFTVSFFSEEYRKALGYMGSHSGRNEDKAAVVGLTPLSVDNSVMFKEASMTFVFRKVYPVNENGEWEPHWVYVGEIKEVKENK